MSNLLQEASRWDVGLPPQQLATSNATGDFLPMTSYRRAVGVLHVGAAADAVTAKIEMMEAKDVLGTGAQAIASATRTVTVPASLQRATLTLVTVLDGQAVTINGLVFTGKTAAPDLSLREFLRGVSDTADAAALVVVINDPTVGLPGVTATSAVGVVTLIGEGEAVITISAAAATITPAGVAAAAVVEVDHFDLSAGFNHVACKVTTVGTAQVGAMVARASGRDAIAHPGQAIAV